MCNNPCFITWDFFLRFNAFVNWLIGSTTKAFSHNFVKCRVQFVPAVSQDQSYIFALVAASKSVLSCNCSVFMTVLIHISARKIIPLRTIILLVHGIYCHYGIGRDYVIDENFLDERLSSKVRYHCNDVHFLLIVNSCTNLPRSETVHSASNVKYRQKYRIDRCNLFLESWICQIIIVPVFNLKYFSDKK